MKTASHNKAIRIFVIDDHFTVRMGLAASLNAEPDMTVVAELTGEDDVGEQYNKLRPSVMIMDLRLGNVSGIDLTASLVGAYPDARILMLSTYSSEEGIHRSLTAGAMGYVLKTAQRDELLRAVRTVHAGHRYVDETVTDILAQRNSRRDLSPREREVVGMIVKGLSNKEIAQMLQIAEVTVKLHVTHLFEKLQVTDRTQAAIRALQRGMVETEL